MKLSTSPGCAPGRSIATSISRTNTAISTRRVPRGIRPSTRRFSSARTRRGAASTSRPIGSRDPLGAVLRGRSCRRAFDRRAGEWPERAIRRGRGIRVGVYGFLAVVLSASIARRLVGRGWLAAIVVWIGTPLVYYMYITPPFSHASSAFAVALFLFVWLRVRETWSAGGAALARRHGRAHGDGARAGHFFRRRAGDRFSSIMGTGRSALGTRKPGSRCPSAQCPAPSAGHSCCRPLLRPRLLPSAPRLQGAERPLRAKRLRQPQDDLDIATCVGRAVLA